MLQVTSMFCWVSQTSMGPLASSLLMRLVSQVCLVQSSAASVVSLGQLMKRGRCRHWMLLAGLGDQAGYLAQLAHALGEALTVGRAEHVSEGGHSLASAP